MKINRVLIGIACVAAGVLAVDMVMFPIVLAAEAQRDHAEGAKVRQPKTLTPEQRAEACLEMAETHLAEKNYPAARDRAQADCCLVPTSPPPKRPEWYYKSAPATSTEAMKGVVRCSRVSASREGSPSNQKG